MFVLDRLELGSPVRIRVFFAHTTGLKPHAPIIVAGRPIGRVETIEPVSQGDEELLPEGGSVAIVAVEGDHVWKVPQNSEIFVSSRGALSERYLEVAPPKGEPGPLVFEGFKTRGADPPALDSVLRRTWANMAVFRAFAEQVRPEYEAFTAALDQLRTQFDAISADLEGLRPLVVNTAPLIDEARDLMDEARKLRAGLGGPDGFDRFSRTIGTARTTMAQVRAAIDRLELLLAKLADEARRVRGRLEASDPIARGQAVIAQIKEAIAKVDPLLAKVDEINQRIKRGEGSLGRLMNDPEFPEDAKELGKILKRQPWKVIAKPKD